MRRLWLWLVPLVMLLAMTMVPTMRVVQPDSHLLTQPVVLAAMAPAQEVQSAATQMSHDVVLAPALTTMTAQVGTTAPRVVGDRHNTLTLVLREVVTAVPSTGAVLTTTITSVLVLCLCALCFGAWRESRQKSIGGLRSAS